MKRKISIIPPIIPFGLAISMASVSAEAALSSNALLAFDAGTQSCDSSTGICQVTGSYFGVDTNQDGVVSAYESQGISPGSDGGLLVGQAQIASGSHSGYPDGTEVAPFDAAWAFLGNTGMHQSLTPTNILSDDGMGNVLLDFSGWGATWNGIPNINLGVAPDGSPGVAVVKCGVDCSLGDSFSLDYSAVVPLDDPSNFGGVLWRIHLEGTVSAVPVPAAVWLFGSGLLGLLGFMRRRRQ